MINSKILSGIIFVASNWKPINLIMKSVRNLLPFIFALLFVVSFVSCDKDEDKIEKDRNTLIQGTWLLYAAGKDGNGDGRISDAEKEYAGDERIFELTLSADGNGTVYENYTDEGAVTTTFNWEWSGDGVIVLTETEGEGESIRINIYMLTETELGVYGGLDEFDSDMVLFFNKKS